MALRLNGSWFTEADTGRTVLFRGVNLGGAKIPVGVPSHERHGFWEDYDRHVTFVGRPFPLHEADDHLRRLSQWGFNLLRFIVTWEAIEHEGPGIYDEAYLHYVAQLLVKCRAYDIKVFIDPHQDAWSRQCGGSGHPGWTLTLAGLNPLAFESTKAALVHNLYPEPTQFPKMAWNTNYQRLAAATMFTLFFAGKRFAPKCVVNGQHVQDYLQEHYAKALQALATRIHECGLEDTVVIGYDTMNEPGQGYLGVPHLDKLSDSDIDFKIGLMPTSFQGMLLASGFPATVERYAFKWDGPKKAGTERVDPQGVEAWLSDSELRTACETFGWQRGKDWPAGCVWSNHGVWDKTTQTLTQPDYFSGEPGLYHQHWLEFLQAYASAIRAVHPASFLFVQPPVLEMPPPVPDTLERLVYTPHWYDGLTLVKKKWCSYNVDFINLNRGKYGTGPLRFVRALRLGEKAIRGCFVDQLKTLQTEGQDKVGNYPCVIGEIGIPYDMASPVAAASSLAVFWAWLSSFFFTANSTTTATSTAATAESPQNRAMDASIHAAECNLLSYVLWQYMPDNDPYWGDRWNGEDLSVWQTAKTSSASTLVAEDRLPKMDKDESALADGPLESESASTVDVLRETPLLTVTGGVNQRDVVSLHRPHPQKTAGFPTLIEFISPTQKTCSRWTFQWRRDKPLAAATEIHVPRRHFPPEDSVVTVSDGRWEARDVTETHWMLHWWVDDHSAMGPFELRLEGAKLNA